MSVADPTVAYPAWLADRWSRRLLAMAIGAGAPIALLLALGLAQTVSESWGPAHRPALAEPRPVEFLAPELRGFAPERDAGASVAHLVHRSVGNWLSGAEIAFPVTLEETAAGARVHFSSAYGVESSGLGTAKLGAATISGDGSSVRVRIPYELGTGYSLEAGTIVVEFRRTLAGDALLVLEDGVERARYPRLRPERSGR